MTNTLQLCRAALASAITLVAATACGGDVRSRSTGDTIRDAGNGDMGDARSIAPSCGDSCAPVQPVTLASGQTSPYGIAVDATHVYWTNSSGTVMKVPVAGGTPIVLASGQENPYGIALDATHVYWANGGFGTGDGTVMKVPLGGGEPTVLAAGQDPLWVAVDQTSVYWTNLATGAVMKVPLDGGNAITLALGQNTQDAKLVVDSANVYFTNFTANTLSKTPIGGGAATVLQNEPVDSLALDSENLYFGTALVGDSTIWKMPLAGGAPAVLARSPDPLGLLASDGADLFWVVLGSGDGRGNPTGDDGTVMKRSVGGGAAPVTLAKGQALPLAIALDARYVYWADSRGGTIMKVAKAPP